MLGQGNVVGSQAQVLSLVDLALRLALLDLLAEVLQALFFLRIDADGHGNDGHALVVANGTSRTAHRCLQIGAASASGFGAVGTRAVRTGRLASPAIVVVVVAAVVFIVVVVVILVGEDVVLLGVGRAGVRKGLHVSEVPLHFVLCQRCQGGAGTRETSRQTTGQQNVIVFVGLSRFHRSGRTETAAGLSIHHGLRCSWILDWFKDSKISVLCCEMICVRVPFFGSFVYGSPC
mmetsp:Transcript_28464/g.66793  ORF Transcript_28464/g.66793 Transcript_28464/m.66793 type:complete len:233 (+) Transcript_28464:1324-2022(+)